MAGGQCDTRAAGAFGGPAGAWARVAAVGAWLGGIGLALQQAQAPGPGASALTVAALAALAGAGVAARLRGPAGRSLTLALLLCAAAGWAWAHARVARGLADTLDPAWAGQVARVRGQVDSLPEATAYGQRFVFQVEPGGAPPGVPSRLSVTWSHGVQAGDDDGLMLLSGPGVDLRAGQRWSLPLRLKLPLAPVNPHARDTELAWFTQGVRALGTVRARGDTPAVRLPDDGPWRVDALRQDLRDRLALAAPGARAAGVLAALAVGDQAAIGTDDWALFRETGVAHLMSISGLHVTMFAWLVGGLAAALWRRWPAGVRACPSAVLGPLAGLAGAAAYALLAGWGVPAQRTVVMVGTVALVRAAGLHWPTPLVLATAAAAVTLGDPLALAQPGFWLSFGAVALLLAAPPAPRDAPGDRVGDGSGVTADLSAPLPAWRRAGAALRREATALVRTQGRVTLGLAPLSLVCFQQLSLSGLLANLVAVPWVTAVVTPLAIGGLAWPPLAAAAAAAMAPLLALLEALRQLPGGVWTAAAPPTWAAVAGLAGAALLMAPVPRRLRAAGALALLPVLAPVTPRPPHGAFELVAADVGQGTAVLVRTRGHLLVFDTGPAWGRDADAGERLLLPLLRARGERRIDVLMLSHQDTDHVGGAASLRAALPVGRVHGSLPPAHPLRQGLPAADCIAGQEWAWDGVHLRVLHPPAGALPAAAGTRPNTLSCVLQVEDANGRRALITGDIERAQEHALVHALPAGALRSDVLLVPHHGSRTSSSPAFLAAVAPRVAVVQAGYLGRFGHPAPEVVRRYQEAGVALVRTDACGAWTWRGDASWCERSATLRPWRALPSGVHGAEVAKLNASGVPR
jgi:competence protein ComEC